MLLAGMATSLPLEPDTPGFDQCGACTLCLDACPTGAHRRRARARRTRCISYLTIELEGSVPDAQRPAVGDHMFGCDICQDVCPWNLAPPLTADAAWQPRVGRDGASAAVLWQRTDHELHAFVRGSAMRAHVAGAPAPQPRARDRQLGRRWRSPRRSTVPGAACRTPPTAPPRRSSRTRSRGPRTPWLCGIVTPHPPHPSDRTRHRRPVRTCPELGWSHERRCSVPGAGAPRLHAPDGGSELQPIRHPAGRVRRRTAPSGWSSTARWPSQRWRWSAPSRRSPSAPTCTCSSADRSSPRGRGCCSRTRTWTATRWRSPTACICRRRRS